MNKRDILEICLARMISNENAGKKIHEETEKAYIDCKKIALNAGYKSECFIQIWNEATKRHAKKLNIRAIPPIV